MKSPRIALSALVLGLSATIPSCDSAASGQVPVHPARGRVLFQGKPLAGALVVFLADPKPADTMPRPVGKTDGDGRFKLHTYLGEDGAPAGKYRLSISLPKRSGEAGGLASKNADTGAPADPIGDRYFNAETSGLTAEVKPGDNELPEIDLKEGGSKAPKGRD